MAITTIRTSAGEFRVRTDEFTTKQDIANKIARQMGHRAARTSNSSGSSTSYQITMGRHQGRGMLVDRVITVYR